jgi:ATP-dependent 26S proteasome regulatory subunit
MKNKIRGINMDLHELELLIESGENIISLQSQLTERISVLAWLERSIARPRGLPCYLWNLGQGEFRRISPALDNSIELKRENFFFDQSEVAHLKALDFLLEQSQEGVFILENLQPFLIYTSTANIQSQMCSQRLISQLVNILEDWTNHSKYLILFGTQEVELPPSLGSLISEVWNPLPNFDKIVSMLIEFLPQLGGLSINHSLVEELALSAGGLTLEEIKSGLRISSTRNGGVDAHLVKLLLDYKIERLRSFDLQFVAQPNVPDFGGLDRIKVGITEVRSDYTSAARSSGLPLPKGWLLVGPPGTGKTFVSKFCAKELGFPMISVDTGAISAGGASYLKRLLTRVEAAAPAVVYFDEFDKLFPGSSQIAEDVNSRQVLGLLLTWLQEKTSKTFVIATLNRLDALPPELTRVGRFDEIYYVGFPQAIERKEILHLHLARFDPRYRDGADPLTESEWRILLGKTLNCTGAELSRMVEKAARRLFHSGKEIRINLPELLLEREAMVPLYLRDTNRILKIENLAKYVAQPSASPDASLYAPPLTTFWGQ